MNCTKLLTHLAAVERHMNSMILFGMALFVVSDTPSFAAQDAADGLTVYNRGERGQNSRQGKMRFANDVLALKPDYVFIYFGLNDTLSEPAFLSLEEYVENLRWMAAQALSAGSKPVLCTIHPVGEEALLKRHKKESYGTERPNGKIDRYNAALRTIANEIDVPVADFARVVTDSGKQIQQSALVGPDGVHLTRSGYEALAECFYGVVAGEIKGKAAIVCLGDSVTWGLGVEGSGTTAGETYPACLRRISSCPKHLVDPHYDLRPLEPGGNPGGH